MLFVSGAVLLSVGLLGYLNQGQSAEPEAGLGSLEDVEHLPVALPYYDPLRANPQILVGEPEPAVSAPLRLVIESIGVDAPVVEMGLDGEGIPYVPLNGQDVAWYSFSSRPGEGGNAVLAGHINWERAPGVFARLDDVQPGETLRLVSDDGHEYTYEVFANFYVDPTNPESLKVMAPTPMDTVTLITCGGSWIPDASQQFGGDYTNRVIVQARLVQSAPAVTVPGA